MRGAKPGEAHYRHGVTEWGWELADVGTVVRAKGPVDWYGTPAKRMYQSAMNYFAKHRPDLTLTVEYDRVTDRTRMEVIERSRSDRRFKEPHEWSMNTLSQRHCERCSRTLRRVKKYGCDRGDCRWVNLLHGRGETA